MINMRSSAEIAPSRSPVSMARPAKRNSTSRLAGSRSVSWKASSYRPCRLAGAAPEGACAHAPFAANRAVAAPARASRHQDPALGLATTAPVGNCRSSDADRSIAAASRFFGGLTSHEDQPQLTLESGPPATPKMCQLAILHVAVERLLLLAHQRTPAFVERPESLLARHRGDDLRQIPFAFRLLGRLDLHQVHVADDAPVLAYAAVLGHEVVDRQLPHLGQHGLGLVGAGGLHGPEVMQHGAVGAGLDEAGRPADLLGEAVGEGARLGIHVVVERTRNQQALRDLQADAVHVGELGKRRTDP